MPRFQLSPSTSSLARLRGDVGKWATSAGVDAGQLGLVVTELAANALAASPEDDVVEVSVELVEPDLEVVVTDRGRGLGPGPYPRRLDDVSLPDDRWAPGGRGLFLVRQLAHSLVADRHDGCTIVAARLGADGVRRCD